MHGIEAILEEGTIRSKDNREISLEEFLVVSCTTLFVVLHIEILEFAVSAMTYFSGNIGLQIVDFGESGPVRCLAPHCKAYINPFMRFIDQGHRFICNLCGIFFHLTSCKFTSKWSFVQVDPFASLQI